MDAGKELQGRFPFRVPGQPAYTALELPSKRCVILGSGDIGLIMARRLTLEGARVVGVYEAKSSPSGLARNIAQCLRDYSIPLHLSKTVTRVFGEDRVMGVEVCSVDEKMNPIKGTEEYIECDGLILSVGLIPENEIAESLEIEMDRSTRGPVVDQNFMTMMEGVFFLWECTSCKRSCGLCIRKWRACWEKCGNVCKIPWKQELYSN